MAHDLDIGRSFVVVGVLFDCDIACHNCRFGIRDANLLPAGNGVSKTIFTHFVGAACRLTCACRCGRRFRRRVVVG